MSWGYVAIAGATLVTGVLSSNAQKRAAADAARATENAANKGISENERMFQEVQKLLAPYVQAGTGAIGEQQALLGLSGPEAQKKAIEAIQSSPQFGALVQQGENAMLQNASATGGLRGGNTQAALAQFRPAILSQLIEQQYGRLGQLASLGQASAAGQAAQSQRAGEFNAGLYGQIGSAQAGQAIATGAANQQLIRAGGQAAGTIIGGRF